MRKLGDWRGAAAEAVASPVLREENVVPEMSKEEGCGWFVAAVVLIAISPAVELLQAVVVRHLWGWFLTPVVHIDPPGVLMTFGLVMLVKFVFHKDKTWKEVDETSITSTYANLAVSIISTLVIWGMAGLIHLVA